MKEILKKNKIVKNSLLFCFYIFRFFLYEFSGFFPRRKNRCVLGSYSNAFNDNAKYLFIYICENRPDIDVAWITSNKKVIEFIRSRGGRAYHRLSINGIWYCLTAKYWFFNAYLHDINYALSKGAVAVNLWHGVPLKKIEHDIENGPLLKLFTQANFYVRNLRNPSLHRRPDFVLSTSEFVSNYSFKSAFRVDDKKCLNFGYPRNEIFLGKSFFSNEIQNKWSEYSFDSLKQLIAEGKRIGIYMPTWRDSNPSFLKDVDFKVVNDILIKKDTFIFLKLHVATPSDILDEISGFSNIKLLDSRVDAYSILSLTSFLITDYSSIMFDYLLLDKPIYLNCFDVDRYKKDSRGFYINYDDIDFAGKYLNFVDILNDFSSGIDMMRIKREIAKNKFHVLNSKSSEKITEFFFNKKEMDLNQTCNT